MPAAHQHPPATRAHDELAPTATPSRALSLERRAELVSRSRERLQQQRRSAMDAEAELRRLESDVGALQRDILGAEQRRELAALYRRLAAVEASELAAFNAASLQSALDAAVSAAEAAHAAARLEAARAEDEAQAVAHADRDVADARAELERAERDDAAATAALNEAMDARPRLRRRAEAVRELRATNAGLKDAAAQRAKADAAASEMLEAARAERRDAITAAAASTTSSEAIMRDSELAAILATAATAVRDFERQLQSRRNRAAFELRVLRERCAKEVKECSQAKLAALTVEAEVHGHLEAARAFERAEEHEMLTQCIAQYEFEHARLLQDLALRPPADQVAARRAQLGQQVEALAGEHARLTEAIDLLERGEEGRRLLAERCDRARERVAALRDGAVADAERQRAALRARRHDDRMALRVWAEDEAPRHAAFEARLAAERNELAARLQADADARAAELAIIAADRDAAMEDVLRLRGKAHELGLELTADAVGRPHRVVDGDAAAEAGSPARADDVTVEVVVQRLTDGGEGAEGPDGLSEHRLEPHVIRERMRAPPRPVLYHAANERGLQDAPRQFNFLAVSLVRSVVGMIRRAGRSTAVRALPANRPAVAV